MISSYLSNSPADTESFAREVSLWARPGYCILLSGELGSGKSTFARAFIRALAPGENFDVPSPSFAIVQSYKQTRVPVAHIDLYRLQTEAEVEELGLDELLDTHVMLVEWPEKFPASLCPDILNINFSGMGETRTLTLEARGIWPALLQRNAQINALIGRSTLHGGVRSFLEGDASSRRYEMVTALKSTAILMDMPKRPDGPIVKNNKPYSAIAHLAENIGAVVGVNDLLLERGYSAPEVYELDLNHGLSLIEPLGTELFGKMLMRGDDMRSPMQAAVDVLADMAGKSWPASVPVRNGPPHRIARYDISAMMIEVDLLPSWYWPHIKGVRALADVYEEFTRQWEKLLPLLDASRPVWTLRDYHSPNLLWLPERPGMRRVGLIDTQDCVLGHSAYDLVSLLQDARVDIEHDMATQLFEHYCGLRSSQGNFDRATFARDFAILGAQRATKILGIFARLYKRDGKPAYLKHIPRVSRHLSRNLAHPALSALKAWHDRNLPLS